jgi:tripartite-type tricarboxylate transporter receptor subunit TctC
MRMAAPPRVRVAVAGVHALASLKQKRQSGGPMSIIRMLAFVCAALAAAGGVVQAQDYPTRSVKIIVPFASGGSGDIFARVVGQHLTEALKQPFVIENRPGAGSIIGSDAVAKSPPDGYTLLLVSSAHATNESLVPNKPFVLMRDLVAVAPINYFDMALVTPPSLPANNVQELIALAKAKPGALNFASSGPGTPYHMAAELFKAMAKIDIVHVPYKLASAARTDVIGGQVQMMFDAVGTMAGNISAKQVKVLATTGKTRSATLSNVPTLNESGVPGYEAISWLGFMAPAGTPAPIVSKLNAEISRLASRPDIKELWAKQSMEPSVMTPAEYEKFLRAEIDKWAEVVKVSGAKIE